jgi:hypothetical protein
MNCHIVADSLSRDYHQNQYSLIEFNSEQKRKRAAANGNNAMLPIQLALSSAPVRIAYMILL